MAFVSDKYKFVFIHIPKNAGTSISDALARMHDSCLVGIHNGIYNHDGVGLGVPPKFRPNRIDVHDTYKGIVTKYPKAKDYKAFTVISNPWERIYSFWKHKRRRCDSDLDHSLTFNQALKASNVVLLQPQLWWFSGSKEILTLRKEKLNENFNAWVKYNKFPEVELGRLNKDIEPNDYREHYNSYSRDLIKEFYRAEIERFGYDF